ncbi:hypothetical protein K439DRAFT_1623823 [Ramaria rubella]|nr:hypothetical protein K439DRAFT_1623823 [Ramaria rubella]
MHQCCELTLPLTVTQIHGHHSFRFNPASCAECTFCRQLIPETKPKAKKPDDQAPQCINETSNGPKNLFAIDYIRKHPGTSKAAVMQAYNTNKSMSHSAPPTMPTNATLVPLAHQLSIDTYDHSQRCESSSSPSEGSVSIPRKLRRWGQPGGGGSRVVNASRSTQPSAD